MIEVKIENGASLKRLTSLLQTFSILRHVSPREAATTLQRIHVL